MQTKTKIGIENTVKFNLKHVIDTLVIYDFEPVLSEEAEVILAIGGDSAVLKASKYKLPILAWNQGTLGFLTTGPDLDFILEAYINDTLILEERDKLSVFVNDQEFTVLNEVAIVGEDTGRLVKTDLYIDDKQITTYKGDGLLVSTSTGSTAYNLSAGGSLVEPGIACMLLTPISPFTMNVRPLIIDSTHRITLKKVVKIVLDGYESLIPWKEIIDIEYTDEKALIYRFNDENFFEAIIEKLGWNASI